MGYQVSYIKPFGVLLEPEGDDTHLIDLDITILRQLFGQHQLIVLRGFETFKNAEDFANYCELWGQVSLWPFGKVLDLVEHDDPSDHIFDHSYMPLHWDGMYRLEVPEYQIFHCLKAPLSDQGGKTTFSNTLLALNNASSELKEIWNKVTGIYQRKMSFYNSKTISPIITKHPYKDFSVIRYNEPVNQAKGHFINSPDLEFIGLDDHKINHFHQNLKNVLYHPSHFYAHQWQENDVVIADNFSLLHGREAFISKSPRYIQRVQALSNPAFKNPHLESYQ